MFTCRITSVFANKLKHVGLLVLEFVRQRCDSSANCVMWSASSRSLFENVWNPFLAPFTSFTIRGFGSKFPAGLPLSKPGSVTFWSVTGCDHKHRIRCQQNKIKTSKKPERYSGRRFASAIMFLCSSLCQCANTLLWYTIMWYQHAESNSSEFSLFVLIALWSHPECCKSFDISHASLITSHHLLTIPSDFPPACRLQLPGLQLRAQPLRWWSFASSSRPCDADERGEKALGRGHCVGESHRIVVSRSCSVACLEQNGANRGQSKHELKNY